MPPALANGLFAEAYCVMTMRSVSVVTWADVRQLLAGCQLRLRTGANGAFGDKLRLLIMSGLEMNMAQDRVAPFIGVRWLSFVVFLLGFNMLESSFAH